MCSPLSSLACAALQTFAVLGKALARPNQIPHRGENPGPEVETSQISMNTSMLKVHTTYMDASMVILTETQPGV